MALSSLAPRRRRYLVGLASFAAAILVFVAYALVDDEPAGGRAAPVVVVPGYGQRAASLATLVGYLDRHGRNATATSLPLNGVDQIERSARALADAVDASGARAVDLVGFSAGAIVVRYYVKAMGGIDVARRVVLLGGPNHGAELAQTAASIDPSACGGACAELVPGSSFLERLNSGDETPGDARYFSIWTAQDETVTPPESAVLQGAVNVRLQNVCPSARLGHGDLMTHPVALEAVLQAVNGRLTPSTNLRCTAES